MPTAEHRRLDEYREGHRPWKWWGPYLSERAWGTVREDFGQTDNPWRTLSHEDSRSTAYRWNEDGLMGICDREQRLCFAITLWNHRDGILKERLYGLGGPEGNHGEDVKEYYYYVDCTPTHSYMRMMYRYPQGRFPYEQLRNHGRRRSEPELELIDTGVFAEQRFFDVIVEYAKSDEEDILIQIEVVNRGPEKAPLLLMPTLWLRNTWSWSGRAARDLEHPRLRERPAESGALQVRAELASDLRYSWFAQGAERLVFTENETHNESGFVKNAFHRFVHGEEDAVSREPHGTKVGALYRTEIDRGQSRHFQLRLCRDEMTMPFDAFAKLFDRRRREADEFYEAIQSEKLSPDERRIQRQALAGMLLNKQFYNFDYEAWLEGDAVHSVPPPETLPPEHPRRKNRGWEHLKNFDVISMPDKWEYPWYATWDLAFHCLPLSLVDIDFAKRQLELFTREWYMHPNGQLPAYEWALNDANPPVHPWATWRVYEMEREIRGCGDRTFLEGIFLKLVINFASWVNREDEDGNNIFQGGFLGLDNIGLFPRSELPPTGKHFDQCDGTSWMAAFSLQMMRISLELAKENPVYEDMAAKFFEHFLRIARAMTTYGPGGDGLWDEKDGFFYDALHFDDGSVQRLEVRSLVGLIPLFAVEILEPHELEQHKTFKRRTEWFLRSSPLHADHMASTEARGIGQRRLVALLNEERLRRVLERMLDKNEFLSEFGIRSLSKAHKKPAEFRWGEDTSSVKYEPAESQDAMFGGNSNWRGPIWFPVNYLIIDALRRFHRFYGNRFRIAFPTGSSNRLTLDEVADEISKRLAKIFRKNRSGKRPVYSGREAFHQDPKGLDLILFHEYFHGENGVGLGAQHQTGWTGLVANLLEETAGKK